MFYKHFDKDMEVWNEIWIDFVILGYNKVSEP